MSTYLLGGPHPTRRTQEWVATVGGGQELAGTPGDVVVKSWALTDRTVGRRGDGTLETGVTSRMWPHCPPSDPGCGVRGLPYYTDEIVWASGEARTTRAPG